MPRMADKLIESANVIAHAYVAVEHGGGDYRDLPMLEGRIGGLVIGALICEGADFDEERVDENVEKLIHGARHGLPDQILS